MAGQKQGVPNSQYPFNSFKHLGTFFKSNEAGYITLQGTNISHLGKRKIIFKMPFWGDMLVPWRVIHTTTEPSCLGTSPCVSLTRRKVPDPMGADIQRPPWSDGS